MSSWTLAASGAATIATAAAFLVVAWDVARRPAARSLRAAATSHAVFWAGLGTYLVMQGALTLTAAAGRLSEPLYFGSRVVAVPILCVAIVGLAHYLLFLYMGQHRLVRVVPPVFGAVILAAFAVTLRDQPGLIVSDWVVTVADTTPAYRLLYLTVGLPMIAATVAYLALMPRVQGVQRYRMAMSGLSLGVYVAGGLAARLAGKPPLVFASLVGLGAVAAACAILAHHPPGWVRARLLAVATVHRRARLQGRMRELV